MEKVNGIAIQKRTTSRGHTIIISYDNSVTFIAEFDSWIGSSQGDYEQFNPTFKVVVINDWDDCTGFSCVLGEVECSWHIHIVL